MTLGQALAARVILTVTCRACRHRAAPDVAELVARHGTATIVIDWAPRLVCTQCGAHDAEFVVSGYRAPEDSWLK